MTQTILCCTRCPAQADPNRDPESAFGWQVVPTVICEQCIDKELASRPTHAAVEQENHFRGKVIRTLTLVPFETGRQA